MTGRQLTVIQPPLRVSRDFIDYPYHSDMATVQAAAVLREAGFAIQLVNAFDRPSSGLEALEDNWVFMGAPVDDIMVTLEETGLFLIHYTPFHRPPSREPVLGELLERLRRAHPDTPIVLADLYQSGEHYVEVAAERIAEAYPEADCIIKYQAERILAGVCADLIAAGCPTTATLLNGPDVDNLDDLPLPAWDLVDLPARDRFMDRVVRGMGRGPWAFPVDGRTLPLITSRGCPHRCGHCSSNPGRPQDTAKRQVRHGHERLAELVASLVGEHGATRIEIMDEMVNVDATHFDVLVDRLAASNVAYDFPNGMRADRIKPRHLEAMAGRITTLSVSAESGVQQVVDTLVDKKLDLATIEDTVREAAKLNIPTLVHFIIGMPGETKKDINETLDYATHLNDEYGAWPAVQFATPLPGTRLADDTDEALDVALPIVEDYGPLFQHEPVTQGVDFTPDDLKKFKWTFDQRMMAGNAAKKVIMNVTYRCNNHCNFCAVGNRSQIDGNFDRQREILQEYREKGLTLVDFDGGEPTLYDKLIPLVRYCRHVGYERINVTTNGRMCVYDNYAEKLVNSGLTTLLFSVHGPDAKSHGKQVGVPEAFEQTTAGIRNCVKFAPDGVELGLNVTVTKGNHQQLPDIAQLTWDLGLRWMNIQFLTPFGRATERVNPDTQASADIAMRVIDEWRDRMKFQIINLPFCFMPGYQDIMVGDLLKIQRHMVFVNNEDVNLYEYLGERRNYESECYSCPHKVFCSGFYELEDVPEPPWYVTEADTHA